MLPFTGGGSPPFNMLPFTGVNERELDLLFVNQPCTIVLVQRTHLTSTQGFTTADTIAISGVKGNWTSRSTLYSSQLADATQLLHGIHATNPTNQSS